MMNLKTPGIFHLTEEQAKSYIGEIVYEHYDPGKLLLVESVECEKSVFEAGKLDLVAFNGTNLKGEKVRVPADMISSTLRILIAEHEKKLKGHKDRYRKLAGKDYEP